MRLLLISLISIFLSTSVWAGEWQNKPIHCMDKDTGNFIIVEYHQKFAKYCILSQGSGLVVKAE